MAGKLIVGSNNQVPSGVNVIAIGVSDREFTSDDEGKIFLGDDVTISDDGVLSAAISPPTGSHTTNFSTIPGRRIYFVDATSGNVTVTLTDDLNEYTFIKTDASANTVILDPASGNINGAGTYTLTTQYQKVTVVYDGTNFYV